MKKISVLVFILALALLVPSFLAGCSDSEAGDGKYIKSTDELAESKIGVQTGTVFDGILKEKLPDCKVEYFDTNFDMLAALDSGKIDAYVSDEPFAESIIQNDRSNMILEKLSDDRYGYVFPMNGGKSELLCRQMNEYLSKAESDGTIDGLRKIWLGTDETGKDVDYDGLTGENGVLKLAVSTDGAEPFTYIKNGKIIGYEVDIAVRFCREYGYGIEVEDYTFSGLLGAVASGKSDFGASCISITDERKQTLLMSDAYYNGGVVLVVKCALPLYSSFGELSGKQCGVLTGSVFDVITENRIPDVKMSYFNACSDFSVALESDKIDFYVIDEPVARYLTSQYDNHAILGILQDDHYGAIFKKDDQDSVALCAQFNEFLAKSKADGSLDEIIDVWFGSDTSKQVIDYENLPAENGVLDYAFTTSAGVPYAYVKDGKYAGYEVAVAVSFCREYGYGIRMFDSSFTGMISAVSTGKCDFGSSGVSITEERKQAMLFSDPTYDGGIAVVVKTSAEANEKSSFFASVADSFDKTFIREGRWKMFLSGIAITMLVTVLSAVFGTAIGFALFMIYRKSNKAIAAVFDTVAAFLEKMPVVVILMILYYVIFGSSDIDGIIISIIGFTVLFSFGVLGMLETGVGAVDKGQTEAALSLGYTDSRAFLTMILPQSLRYIMPGYKSSLVSLVKDTSIVGYIAVQDLTKVSDIVRSRTYEAFFPLIATAAIYFFLAFVLINVIKGIEISTDPRRRNAAKILKGVKTK